jgi:hypothetical protein
VFTVTLGAAPATVTVDYTHPKQTIAGFGASITWVAIDLRTDRRSACCDNARLDDGKPASAEFRTLAGRVRRLDRYVVNHSLPRAGVVIGRIRSAMGKLTQAFEE